MERIQVVLLVFVMISAVMMATPALATHELEHDPQRIAEEQARVLPPGYTDELQVYVWGRGSGIGLYGFISFCYNDGGYWYWGGNDWYWHSC